MIIPNITHTNSSKIPFSWSSDINHSSNVENYLFGLIDGKSEEFPLYLLNKNNNNNNNNNDNNDIDYKKKYQSLNPFAKSLVQRILSLYNSTDDLIHHPATLLCSSLDNVFLFFIIYLIIVLFNFIFFIILRFFIS